MTKLSQEEQGELTVLTQAHLTKLQLRKNQAEQHPALAFAVWLFTPPSKQAGRLAYVAHRVLTIPIRCGFLKRGSDMHFLGECIVVLEV